MKKVLIIIAIILTLLIGFLTTGCIKQIPPETTEAKSYTIKVSTIDWQTVNLLKSAIKDEGKKAFMEDVFIKNNTTVNFFYAKEVISYSETSIRFIDNTGKEQFISAGYIEVTAQ